MIERHRQESLLRGSQPYRRVHQPHDVILLNYLLLSRKVGRWHTAGEIKRHPEVETLLVARDNNTEVTGKVLSWLMEAAK